MLQLLIIIAGGLALAMSLWALILAARAPSTRAREKE